MIAKNCQNCESNGFFDEMRSLFRVGIWRKRDLPPADLVSSFSFPLPRTKRVSGQGSLEKKGNVGPPSPMVSTCPRSDETDDVETEARLSSNQATGSLPHADVCHRLLGFAPT